jgi:hypothetical protein
VDCVGPIIILLIAVAQIVAQVRKGKEEARRRAVQSDAARPPAQPPRAEQRALPPPWVPVDGDEEPDEIEAGPEEAIEPEKPRWAPPGPAVRVPEPPAPAAAPAPGPLARRRQRLGRLDRSRLRDAMVLMEVLGPPVALRDR